MRGQGLGRVRRNVPGMSQEFVKSVVLHSLHHRNR